MESWLSLHLQHPFQPTQDRSFDGSFDQRRRPIVDIGRPIDTLQATTIHHGRDPDRVPMNAALIQDADLRSSEIAGERWHAASPSPGSIHRLPQQSGLQVGHLVKTHRRPDLHFYLANTHPYDLISPDERKLADAVR